MTTTPNSADEAKATELLQKHIERRPERVFAHEKREPSYWIDPDYDGFRSVLASALSDARREGVRDGGEAIREEAAQVPERDYMDYATNGEIADAIRELPLPEPSQPGERERIVAWLRERGSIPGFLQSQATEREICKVLARRIELGDHLKEASGG